jgi:hypothetical protein
MKQLEEYRIKADNIMKDLDDDQRLKRKQLLDAETKCLREVEDKYNQEYASWQNKLRFRKLVSQKFLKILFSSFIKSIFI